MTLTNTTTARSQVSMGGLEAFDPPRYRFHRRTAKTGGCQASSQLPNRESRSRQRHIGERCYRQVAYLPNPAACPLKAVMGRCDRCSCRDRDMSNRARYECISAVSGPSILWVRLPFQHQIENNAILLDMCNGERGDEVFDIRVEVVFQWAWRVHRRALVRDGKPIRISQTLVTISQTPSFPRRTGEEHRNAGAF